jgi:hypothetical protein
MEQAEGISCVSSECDARQWKGWGAASCGGTGVGTSGGAFKRSGCDATSE